MGYSLVYKSRPYECVQRCGKKKEKEKMENGSRYNEIHFNLQFINKACM